MKKISIMKLVFIAILLNGCLSLSIGEAEVETRQWLWRDVLRLQNFTKQIVWITDLQSGVTLPENVDLVIISMDVKLVDEPFLMKAYKSVAIPDQNLMYIIDDPLASNENLLDIIKIVRKMDKYNPIVIYSFHFILQKVYNVYWIQPDSYLEGLYNFFMICAFCNKGQDELVRFNSWSTKTGFAKDFTIANSLRLGVNRKLQ